MTPNAAGRISLRRSTLGVLLEDPQPLGNVGQPLCARPPLDGPGCRASGRRTWLGRKRLL